MGNFCSEECAQSVLLLCTPLMSCILSEGHVFNLWAHFARLEEKRL